MNKAMLSLITVFLLAACGQTGPLVLPQDAPATEAQPSDERTGQ
ncbi:LPS translocon maturation chaperone LptM [Simiduia aestuariiviva]|uniref:Putative small lipoprotein YifL n=1 Tax=Simiduia aestuariiviva TaxID=1510459 RepID=A0A839UTD6_9GAMM|nr:lipoprotein [Simiduia aestuariiviva]MBB3169689.1 putative small lipoprotein YifL [Simiduia aestuariiviva]